MFHLINCEFSLTQYETVSHSIINMENLSNLLVRIIMSTLSCEISLHPPLVHKSNT